MIFRPIDSNAYPWLFSWSFSAGDWMIVIDLRPWVFEDSKS